LDDRGHADDRLITTYDLDGGPHSAPYEVEVAGEHSSYRIGANAELQVEPIRNPVTGNEVHPRLLLPEGLLTPTSASAGRRNSESMVESATTTPVATPQSEAPWVF
jgi:hypothetical protein